MILERLYLENYKQFREPLELFPPEGAVGIVGANGSGKTTLFEAILWTFFGSRGGGPRFANDSIPWSGGSTADRTLVEVTLNVGGAPYRVSRSLHRNKTEAQVHDGSENQIVGGSAEVSQWVQESLLGMDRVAFEATFFARQKELEFFAGVTGVERQREIARILGIEQVEAAQKLLRSDRNALRGEVGALERILENIDHEALEEHLQQVRERRGVLASRARELGKELEDRTEAFAAARAEADRLEKLYRRHNALERDLREAESVRERAAERIADLRTKLEQLAEDERKISRLEPKSQGLARVKEEIARSEEARRRMERLDLAQRESRRLRREAHDAAMAAADMLEKLDYAGDEPLPGWSELFEIGDEVERLHRARDLLASADAEYLRAEKNLQTLRDIQGRYRELVQDERELGESARDCEAARAEVERLDAEMRGLTSGEPLEERLGRLRKRQGLLQRQAAQQQGHADADEGEAAKLEKARRMIEASDELARCPTCQRGFSEDEHAEVIQTLRRQEEEFRSRAGEAREECRRLDREAEELAAELAETDRLQARVYGLREERTAAAARLERLQDSCRELEARVQRARETLAGTEPPTESAIERTALLVEHLRKLRDAYPELRSLVSAHDGARETAAKHEKEAEKLSGGPAYDPERHRELVERRTEIERIRGSIETLRAHLEERPDVERRMEAAREQERQAAGKAARLREELSGLDFDEGAYLESRERVAEAERLRDEARERRDETDREFERLEHRVENLKAELERYEEQRKLADERSLRVASLGEMDKLLSEFYRELTSRVRPKLQDEASALIKVLTDGRYDRIEFDQNYGVRLFDGLSDAYEISRFSGGEADIVSLCARVALSKMISARGSGALGFIVLDEVFGALDADRRRNVLLALDRLKRAFGQIFIISHVGDVQESALLDELWMVEEDESGRSSVRRLVQSLEDSVRTVSEWR